MSISLNVNFDTLTQAQREALAGFILTYPGNVVGEPELGASRATPLGYNLDDPTVKKWLEDDDEQTLGLVSHKPDAEVEKLNHDQETDLPELAFGTGDAEAAAAFGLVLPQGATVAPSIAAVGLTSTVREVTTDTLAAPSVPAPHAPTQDCGVATVAPSTGTPVALDKRGLPWDTRIHTGTKRKKANGEWCYKPGVDPALVARVEDELRQVMAAPPAAAGGDRAVFIGLVGRASAALNGGKITQEEITTICGQHGLPALPLLANRLDLVAPVAAAIDNLIAGRA